MQWQNSYIQICKRYDIFAQSFENRLYDRICNLMKYQEIDNILKCIWNAMYNIFWKARIRYHVFIIKSRGTHFNEDLVADWIVISSNRAGDHEVPRGLEVSPVSEKNEMKFCCFRSPLYTLFRQAQWTMMRNNDKACPCMDSNLHEQVSECMSEWTMNEWVTECMHVLLSGWVSECISERMAVWMSEWLSVCMCYWVAGWVSAWVSEWLCEWVSGWVHVCVIEWLGEWVHEWASGCVNEWVAECMYVLLSDWVSECMSERVAVWMSKWLSACMCYWVAGWVSAWVSEWLCEWVSGWVHVCVIEWLGEWVHEWASGCVNE